MNYDQALEISKDGKPSGKWRFTRTNDGMNGGEPFAIGYCQTENHTHNSKEEAEQCYKKYELDNSLRLNGATLGEDTLRKCQAENCEEFSNQCATVGAFYSYILCKNHMNRETVEELFPAGTSIHS